MHRKLCLGRLDECQLDSIFLGRGRLGEDEWMGGK